MNRWAIPALVVTGVLVCTGCVGSNAPVETPMTTPPSQAPTATPVPTPSDMNGLIVPAFIGMRWIEAQGRAAAAGFTVVPVISGPPGPVRPECQVVQQNPPPGVTVPAPVVNLVLTCPQTPIPDGPSPQ